jgi:glycine/D-amino acid oxidase-like deaminating enzyme/DNA-binding MarR family transcriptional regulator
MLSPMARGADVTSGPRSGASFGGSRRAVVVGAGAIGLATAAELARKGWTVTVADAGSERLGASDISFARLNASEKTRRDYFELNAAGMAAFRSLAAAEGRTPPWLRLTGHLEWETTPDRRRRLRERTRLVESWGYAVTVLSGKEVRETLEPDLLAPDDEEVTFFPDEGYVETAAMLADLMARARAHGVEFRLGVLVRGIVSSGGRVRGAELATGEVLPADVVVSAAGRWTSELAEHAGAVVPLLGTSDARVAGFLARTAPTTTSFSRSVFSPGLNLRPDTDGRLVLQAFDLDDVAAADTAGAVPQRIARELARRLRRTLRLPGPVAVDDVQVGVRALPVDGFPVVGWAGTLDGFYVVVSHSGVTLCLLLGRLVATEIAEGRDEPTLAPFRPQRFDPAAGAAEGDGDVPTGAALRISAVPGDHVDHLIEQWRDILPELDVSPMEIIARISRLSRILEREADALYADFGLNRALFGVLAALRRAGPPYQLSPTDLYNSLLITSGAVTNRLERLTAAGLVRRFPDPHDGRSLLVALTPKGRRLIDRVVTLHYERERELLSPLGPRQRKALANELRRLLLAFEDGAPPEQGDGSNGATARSNRRRRAGSAP